MFRERYFDPTAFYILIRISWISSTSSSLRNVLLFTPQVIVIIMRRTFQWMAAANSSPAGVVKGDAIGTIIRKSEEKWIRWIVKR